MPTALAIRRRDSPPRHRSHNSSFTVTLSTVRAQSGEGVHVVSLVQAVMGELGVRSPGDAEVAAHEIRWVAVVLELLQPLDRRLRERVAEVL